MGFGRWYSAQKAGVQIAVAGGILALVGGVVAGVFGSATWTSSPRSAPVKYCGTCSPPALSRGCA